MPDLRLAGRRLVQVALALATVSVISALAHLPVGSEPRTGALRLALRTRSARIEICRDRSESELAALPAHLRQARDCEERPVDYRLLLAIDGVERIDRRVEHRGLRRSRPLVVDELIPIEPGRRIVEVRFLPAPVPGDRLPDESLETLPRSVLEEAVDFTAGRIEVVVLDESGDLIRLPGTG